MNWFARATRHEEEVSELPAKGTSIIGIFLEGVTIFIAGVDFEAELTGVEEELL